MDNRPILTQLKAASLDIEAINKNWRADIGITDIIQSSMRYHVAYDEVFNRPIYCCMRDSKKGKDNLPKGFRCYYVTMAYGQYSDVHSFLYKPVQSYVLVNIPVDNVIPINVPGMICEDVPHATFCAACLSTFTPELSPGNLAMLDKESYVTLYNEVYYRKVGVITGIFLATIEDTSVLCASLTEPPEWATSGADVLRVNPLPYVLIPLAHLAPVKSLLPKKEKGPEPFGRCDTCKYWDENNTSVLTPLMHKCKYHSPFATKDDFAQYRYRVDFCNAWEARNES